MKNLFLAMAFATAMLAQTKYPANGPWQKERPSPYKELRVCRYYADAPEEVRCIAPMDAAEARKLASDLNKLDRLLEFINRLGEGRENPKATYRAEFFDTRPATVFAVLR